MQYGSTEHIQKWHDGRMTTNATRHTVYERVDNIQQAHALLDEMIALGLIDPAISIETDITTGKIKRVAKSWTTLEDK